MTVKRKGQRISDLAAGGRQDGLGIWTPRPRLTWRLSGADAETFRVHGASSLDALITGRPDLFDLVLPVSAGSGLDWPAADLASRQAVWWRVRPDNRGWSAPHRIEAPLWNEAEWEAHAITSPAWLRTDGGEPVAFPQLEADLHLAGPVSAARLYLTGNAVVVAAVNGRAALDAELEPGYSQQRTQSPATVWDVAPLLHEGVNTVRFSLGGGISHLPLLPDRYTKFVRTGTPWVRARIEVDHLDGSRTILVTDGNWRARLGPTLVAHWYGGETTDLNHATEWGAAAVTQVSATPWWRATPPVRVVQTLEPSLVVRRPDGRRLIDFGVNSAGRPRLHLRHAELGTPITVTPSELLVNGLPDQTTTGSPIWDRLVPDSAVLDWYPEFVYHGARYLLIEGLDERESDAAVTWEVLRADDDAVGSFESSDPFYSALHRIIDRAVQSNMFSVFTDCPHREKLGWIEQLHLNFDTLARGYDVHAHLTDAVNHMIESQTADGLIPTTAPELVVFDDYPVLGDSTAFRDDVNWGAAIVELPWLLYRWYGDESILAKALPAAERYLAYVDSRSHDDLIDFGLGDWVALDTSTPRGLVATHGWLQALRSAARTARVLGAHQRAEAWEGRLDVVAAAFAARYRDPVSGTWGSGSQGSWALAATTPGIEQAGSDEAATGLVDAIHAAGGALTVGENALPSLIETLTRAGRGALLDRLIRRDDAAGYGYQLRAGATALTESWRGPDGDTGVASQNHFMLGMIDAWLTGHIAGLRQHEDSVGWATVVIEPLVLDGVQDAATRFDSPRGPVSVAWRRRGDAISISIELPPGMSGETRFNGRSVVLGPGHRNLLVPTAQISPSDHDRTPIAAPQHDAWSRSLSKRTTTS